LSDSPDSDPSNSVSINGYVSKPLSEKEISYNTSQRTVNAPISLEIYPNPFNPETQISYNLPRESRVTLSVYNIAGQKVATLAAGRQPAGTHTAIFDGKSLPAGIYLVNLQVGRENHLQKVLLVK
ncbi:MAG: T9SS type A sorting domain-containing protein, partial [Calditrichaeota bacterium]|nr:T9SS type A sorting domain-containing protein [Calditrichota bacterium]